MIYRPIARLSGPYTVDLPVHDAEEDDGDACKIYAMDLQEKRPLKKYLVLPSNHTGGRRYDMLPEE